MRGSRVKSGYALVAPVQTLLQTIYPASVALFVKPKNILGPVSFLPTISITTEGDKKGSLRFANKQIIAVDNKANAHYFFVPEHRKNVSSLSLLYFIISLQISVKAPEASIGIGFHRQNVFPRRGVKS